MRQLGAALEAREQAGRTACMHVRTRGTVRNLCSPGNSWDSWHAFFLVPSLRRRAALPKANNGASLSHCVKGGGGDGR